MSSIRAIVVDPSVAWRLAIKEVEAPQAGPSEALVQVDAISLNRGEVKHAMGPKRAGDLVGIWPELSSSKLLMVQGRRSGAELWA
jgi:NADPH:quinone reductase-like Zn-dependent oxidoreductase